MRRPLLMLAIPTLFGVAAYGTLQPPALILLLGSAACCLLAMARTRVAPCCLVAGAFLLGWASPASVPQGPVLQGEVRLLGRIVALHGGSGGTLELESRGASPGPWRVGKGRVQVFFPDGVPPLGSRLVLTGRAWPVGADVLPGELDPIRMANIHRAPTVVRVGRHRLVGREPAPPRSAPAVRNGGLLKALATGRRDDVPEETMATFRRTGTRHLLAVSGLHLGLVGGVSGWIAARVARLLVLFRPASRSAWVGGLVALAATASYGQLAGWPVSARRAALMVGIGGVALALERSRDPWQLLSGAAMVIVLADPGAITGPAWQLSFGAVLGMLVVSPRLTRFLPPDLPRALDWAARAVITSLAATAGTLPALALWFQEVPTVGPLANLLAIPLVGGVATPMALLAWTLPDPIATWAAIVGDTALELALAWLGSLDGPILHPAVGPMGALGLLAAVCMVRRPAASCSIMLVVLFLRPMPAGRMVLTFLSVGQGDATLVEWPGGERWLVDAGPSGTGVARWLRRRGIRELDLLVLSHAHPDHSAGMAEIIETMRVRSLWLPPAQAEDALEIMELARSRGVGVMGPAGGAMVELSPARSEAGPRRGRWPSPASRTTVLHGHRGDYNDASLVLLLSHGAHNFLFTGDVGRDVEALMAPHLPLLDVVKVPHHGSRTSSGPHLVGATRGLAVISCGSRNHFGHPHPQVLHGWGPARLFRTDQDGTIQVVSDGERLQVRAWRAGEGWREQGGAAERASAGSPYRTSVSSSSMSWSASLESSMNR